MTAVEVAKIYVRHNTAIVSLTVAIMVGAYLGQITEAIWATYIVGVGGCVYLDKNANAE